MTNPHFCTNGLGHAEVRSLELNLDRPDIVRVRVLGPPLLPSRVYTSRKLDWQQD